MDEKATGFRYQQQQASELQQMRPTADILHVLPSRSAKAPRTQHTRRAGSSAAHAQSPTVSPLPRISPGAASRRPSSPSSTCRMLKGKYERQVRTSRRSQEPLSRHRA